MGVVVVVVFVVVLFLYIAVLCSFVITLNYLYVHRVLSSKVGEKVK